MAISSRIYGNFMPNSWHCHGDFMALEGAFMAFHGDFMAI
jgi:hypothetical protein